MSDLTDPTRAAFAARLERFRGTMTPDEFDRLVDDMVTTAHRLDAIDTRGLGRHTPSTRHTTGSLRAE